MITTFVNTSKCLADFKLKMHSVTFTDYLHRRNAQSTLTMRESIFLSLLLNVLSSYGKKVCKGVVEPEYVNYSNIKRFEGCTKIDGSIIIVGATFTGDTYLNIMGLHPDAFEVFSSVQDITGYLVVQGEHPHFNHLKYFRNLTRIRGKETSFNGESFSVLHTSLKYLGLTSLKTIRRGDVIIANNRNLCYIEGSNFKSIIRRKSQRIIVSDNRAASLCYLNRDRCSSMCMDKGCWGPGFHQCIGSERIPNAVDNW